MSTQLAFPPSQGLPFEPGPPTIDGYIEPDPGIPIQQLEAGYVGGSRFTFAESSGANSSGAATVAFQGIKPVGENLIVLAWVIRFDFSFDDDDRIVCFLRPSATAAGNERRIDIQPNFQGLGAGPTAPGDPNDIHGSASFPGVTVTTNRNPHIVTWYTPSGTHPVWTPMTAPANSAVKVRSSQIGTGSGSTARYWSVELQLPTSSTGAQAGGAQWIDLQPNFGLYFNVIRVCSGQGCGGIALNGDFCAEFAWPNPASLITDPPSQLVDDWQISSSSYGEGIIVPDGGTNPAAGVQFRNHAQGIGIRSGGPGGAIGTNVDMTLNTTNTIVARVFNNDGAAANGVSCEFRLADFGLGPYGNSALWDLIGIHGPGNPTPPATVPVGSTDVDLSANWTITAADRAKYGPLWDDQCLWALLDSAAGANFAESSVRRNLALINLSKAKHPLTVTGRGHGVPAGGASKHDFVLHVVDVKYRGPAQEVFGQHGADEVGADSVREPSPLAALNLETTLTGAVSADPGAVVWLHVVNGYKCTGKRLTIGKRKFTVWTHAGACAFLGNHPLGQGEDHDNVGLAWEFSGGGIQRRSDGVYYVPVPYNADVKLDVGLEAGADVKPGDPTPPNVTPLGPATPPTVGSDTHGQLTARVQFLLSVEGYGIGATEIDGSWGPETTNAVKAFQTAQGLSVDGAVGPQTWGALFAGAPVLSVPFPDQVGAGAAVPAVAGLQHKLNRARPWFARYLAALAQEGQLGNLTEAMVKALQQWASLAPDGVAGLATFAVRSGPTLWDHAGTHAPPEKPATPPTVDAQSTGAALTEATQKAQFLLSAEGYGIAPAQVDGTFGPATVAAVHRFQAANGLTADGVVGPTTWGKLIAGAPIRQRPFPDTLQKGESDAGKVRALQATLNAARPQFAAAEPPLAVSGVYDQPTIERVMALQRWGAVIIDGIVSYRTWSVSIGPSLWAL